MKSNWKEPKLNEIEWRLEENLATSGDPVEVKCRFGRDEANPGSDKCQACSATGGAQSEGLPGQSFGKEDYTGCPDNMPEKI